MSDNRDKPPMRSPCRTCGACCAYSRDWPRFTTEDESALHRIPAGFMDLDRGRMRCVMDRCSALIGAVGVSTACAIYNERPEVCRACEPGDDACRIARQRFGLNDAPGHGGANGVRA